MIGKVIYQKDVREDHYILKIKAPEITEKAIPAQFVMLSAWQGKDPFLRRPFTFNRFLRKEGCFELLYKKVGKGTEIMSHLREGDEVDLLGPLGNGITLEKGIQNIAIVSRGLGVAPMLPIIDQATENGINVYAFLSAKTNGLLLRKEEIENVARETYYTTDDASLGSVGNVTDYLEKKLKNDIPFDAIYVCGSKRLKRHIEELKKQFGFNAWVILEEHMACGFGACKGCAVKSRKLNGKEEGYLLVCKDGPVFPVEEVEI